MKIEVKKSALESLGVDTLVVFVSKRAHEKAKSKKEDATPARTMVVEGVTRGISSKLDSASEQGALSGANNETVFFRDANISGARHLLAVGLGDPKTFDHETLRQAAASAFSALKGQKSRSAAIALDSIADSDLSAELATQAVTEGIVMANYSFTDFKQKKDEGVEKVILVSAKKSKSHETGQENGRIIAESVNFCRWLGDRPGNRMTPTMLAEEAVKAAKGTKLKVNSWDKSRIKAEKMGSFLSVSLGSTQEPRFITMEYNGASGSKKPICFVGKGLTFDSGGISIKPSGGMEDMKYDMCGGAAVIAAMVAIARLKLKVNAIAFIPATENMPGPNANKPGDIVIARNGKSIEVNNTDAEGRLILADALVYACEQKPAMIVDAATLTGAIVVALGNLHTGVFTRNQKLRERIQRAADAAGEWVWPMPLTDFHVRDMKGTYADLSNTAAKGRDAGSATAAAFLEQFVDQDIPWAHFDIAGTAWHAGDRLPYCPRKGASGAIVRTFVQLAMDTE
ncbi:MAG: leucyl aminopeptidase [Bdellovibrionaceae bacterium]|nr:leucyl aminopeptidase [Pseudobdellovibrionaceae bacterium]